MATLQQYDAFLARVRGSRRQVLVVGDAIDDCYVHGRLTRIAPEGGAPVFEAAFTQMVHGGAANVGEQLRPWNIEVMCMTQFGAWHRKTRYVENDKLVMVASEDQPPIAITTKSVTDAIEYVKPDAVIVADYGKGAVSEELAKAMVATAKDAGIPLIVDPSPSPHADLDQRWYGSACMKMNGDQWARRGAGSFGNWMDSRKLDGMVITHGAKPPIVRLPSSTGHACEHRPPFLPIVDCSGAGDHFLAVLAVGIVHGLPLAEAAEYAHEASKIRAAYRRPRPVLPQEVRGAWDAPLAKILPASEVAGLLGNRKVVFTNGVFSNGITAGHATMLSFAKQCGDILVAAINTDESATTVKGKKPNMPLEQRARILAGQSAVDFVIPFAELTPVETMKALGWVDILVKGTEYSDDAASLPGAELVNEIRFAPEVFKEHTSDWFSRARM